MDLDTYRQESRETWDRLAPGWEDRRDWIMDITARVSDWLAQAVEPRPGQTVLDLAAGTGDLGFAIADRVGPDGRVISSDFSPDMVEVARRQGEARGAANVDYRVVDAMSMYPHRKTTASTLSSSSSMLMAA